MDRDIVLEALSALTGITVKAITELKPGETAVQLLSVENFLSSVLVKALLRNPVYVLSKSLSRLLVSDDAGQSKKDDKADSSEESESETSTLRTEVFVDLEKFLDPVYDYDFRDLKDDSACSRGGEPYRRPCGYYRYALKVKDKYHGGNTWLGSKGWRSKSSPGEWPVSFHGTSIEGAKGITRSHYKAGAGAAYGRGIYSTPDIKTAEDYTMYKTFTSKKTGKTYQVIMQNRINPAERIITEEEDYWLIEVPEDTTPEEEKEIVERSIRPYGILVKEVPDVFNNQRCI